MNITIIIWSIVFFLLIILLYNIFKDKFKFNIIEGQGDLSTTPPPPESALNTSLLEI